MRSARSQSAAFALAAVLLAFGWQALTVHFNYGGNWTALFCTGEKLRVPPQLDSEGIYRFPGAIGYDGQFYHYMAHDPFLQHGLVAYQDAARLRYRRPLVPVAAYLLAGGQDRFVDTALFGVIWLTVFLGAYWSSRYATLCGWHPAWGLAFLMVPATIVAIDRTIVDATLTALVVGFALLARQGPSWRVYVLLTCAALTRETGWLLPAGYCLFLLAGRLWGNAAVFATSVVPSWLWTSWIAQRTQGDLHEPTSRMIWYVLQHPQALVGPKYSLPNPLAWTMTALDYLMLAGVLLAIGLAVWSLARRPRHPEAFAALAFAGLMALTVLVVTRHDPFTWSRLSSPLLVLVAMLGMREDRRLAFAPLILVAARTLVQLTPQVLGILRGLTGLA